MQNLKAQVFFLINVKVGALNNAGMSKVSRFDNGVATKKLWIDGNSFPYISGQSFRRALRDTLQREFGWSNAPLLRGEKTVTMVADPIIYDDADMFGYLNAEKSEAALETDIGEDKTTLESDDKSQLNEGAEGSDVGNVKKNSKAKKKMVNLTVNRKGAVSCSAVRSVGPLSIANNWSSASRHEGDSIPYFKNEYGGNFEGRLSVDCFWAGTFSDYNKTGYKNITEKQKEEGLSNGCIEINHPYEVDQKGLPQKLIRLPKPLREKRITDVFQAGRLLSGLAMQSNNMEDISYNFVIYYSLSSGNHLFGNIMSERLDIEENVMPTEENTSQGDTVRVPLSHPVFNKSRMILNVVAILEEIWDYRKQIQGTVFIGKRAGFLDEYNAELKGLLEYSGKSVTKDNFDGTVTSSNFPKIEFGSVGDMTDRYCDQLKTQIQ